MATCEKRTIMAPMVRIGILPMRLLALDHGADLVYSEEMIDFKLLSAERQDNAVLGTVDFVLPDGTVIFRTCPREKDKLILQVGTSDAARGLAAVKKVENYVSGVDVNMGCPKQFSVQGGMGAALLRQPEKACKILSTLVQGLSIPVTCKIRILPTLDETLTFCNLLASTGIKAIAVHGRTRQERPRHANHNDVIKAISEGVPISVIANGGSKEITCHDDIAKFRKLTGCESVMLGRAVMYNCSIFSPGPLKPIKEIILMFMKYAIRYDTPHCLAKYCVQQMLHNDLESDQGQATLAAYSLERLSQVWGMDDFYQKTKLLHPTVTPTPIALRLAGANESAVDSADGKRRKLNDDNDDIIVKHYRYIRKQYINGLSPKMVLHDWTKKQHHSPPDYDTTERTKDRCFHTILTVAGKRYSTPGWEKAKQIAEQSAAMVCLESLGIHDGKDFVLGTLPQKQRVMKRGTSFGAIMKKNSGCKLKEEKKDRSGTAPEDTSNNNCDTEIKAIPQKQETIVDNVDLKLKNDGQKDESCSDRNTEMLCDATGSRTNTGAQDINSEVNRVHCDKNIQRAAAGVCTHTSSEMVEHTLDHEQCDRNNKKCNTTEVIDRLTDCHTTEVIDRVTDCDNTDVIDRVTEQQTDKGNVQGEIT